MEILFISHKYPPTIGGMQKQSFELIRQAKKAHTVYQLVFTGIEESIVSFFFYLKKRVKKILKAHPSIDIIHLNDGLMGLFSLWLKSYTNIPVVLTFHGLDLVYPNALYQRKIRQQYIHYDGLICVSAATAAECIKRGIPKEKVFVVPNGVDHQLADFENLEPSEIQQLSTKYQVDFSKRKVITLLGRPVKRKGFSWFLEQVATQLDEDVLVLMIGPLSAAKKASFGSKWIPKKLKDKIELLTGGVNDEAAIRILLQQENLKNKVLQTGKLPFSELLSLLRLSDLFVMTNIKMQGDAEGFGLVALEASLSKTVVLASDLEGIPEAIQDGKNGYLLPSRDTDVWVQTIKEKLNQPEELATKGSVFQQFTLENYSWEKMTAGYLAVFEQLLSQKK